MFRVVVWMKFRVWGFEVSFRGRVEMRFIHCRVLDSRVTLGGASWV